MPRKDHIIWYGVDYKVEDVENLLRNNDGCRCPECKAAHLVPTTAEIWQAGMFEDICWEMTECPKCKARIVVRSKVLHTEGVPFDKMLDSLIDDIAKVDVDSIFGGKA